MTVPRSCIALALAVVGCSYGSARESTALECSDGEDNDGDELMNCEDPDCQAHAQCAAYAVQPIRSPPRRPGASGMRIRSRDAAAIEAADGGSRSDEDAGEPLVPPGDAGEPPCGASCDPAECIDGECRDPRAPTGGAFELRILTVEVPDFDAAGMCLDSCIQSLLPTFGFCACAPDPYVEVWRERVDGDQPSTTRIGATAVAPNNRDPSFAEDPIAIDLLPDDAVELVVMDDDPGADSRVYACRPDPSTLTAGPLECSARIFSFLPPYSISAELRPLP